MAKVYFTSDLHLGHRNIIDFCNRPFSDVGEMNEMLIANWNAVVRPEDTVYVLGDYAMGNLEEMLALTKRLMGTIILVAGNHDRCWGGDKRAWKTRQMYLDAGFTAVLDFFSLKLPETVKSRGGRQVLLSHFPYAGDSHDDDRYTQWRLRDNGAWLLHGHVHDAFTVSGRGVNVGTDVWDYTPVEDIVLARLIDDVEAGRVAPF